MTSKGDVYKRKKPKYFNTGRGHRRSLQLVGWEAVSWRVKEPVDGSEAPIYPCSTIVSPGQRLTFPDINDIISDQRTEREFRPSLSVSL